MPFISQAYLDYQPREERARLVRSHAPLGYHPETGDTLYIPDGDRYAGLYVLGVQGVGKSGLLETLIAHDTQVGNAVIVLDPHGDLTAHCIAEAPPERLVTTYVLDMTDVAYPFGVNVFAATDLKDLDDEVAKTQAVERIMHIFEVLWEEMRTQQHLPRYLQAAVHTLLDNPGSTLVDMYDFLLEAPVRTRLLANVRDTSVRKFWKTQFEDLSEADRLKRVQPLVNRLEALFMGRGLVRNIVGQRKTSINFRQAIEHREVVFIKLPVKTVAQDARLIGTIILAQLSAAIFSFADVSEAQRPGLSLYVDEFQHFATSDFDELFTEGRKFGVKVTVAHQFRGQLPPFLQQSTMTARTKVCFQTTPEDGREMAHLFPSSERVVQPEDIETKAAEYLMAHGSDDPLVKDFIEWYLRPLQSYRRGHTVEVRNTGTDIYGGVVNLVGAMSNVNTSEPIRVDDPLPYLDSLLYEVMCKGDSTLPIPAEVVRGFANSGHGFFAKARHIWNSPDLTMEVRFPDALVVPDGQGGQRWTRPPEGSNEQYYHFLFSLRTIMARLAMEPIGKASQPSTANVGQMLNQLPRRAAFVRCGEDVGVIYTNPTPARVSDAALAERMMGIREQTRAEYCHPRAEVGHTGEPVPSAPPPQLADADDPGMTQPVSQAALQAEVSRWEEID